MKLSIVIATRNRQYTAIKVIQEILYLSLQDAELVVSDTSEVPIVTYLSADILNNKNFIYKHTDKELSMDENYSIGIDLASGKYIILIGDDDCILPDIMNIVDYAIVNNIDCITQNMCASFYWNDAGNIIKLIYSKNKSESYKEISSKNALQRILKSSGYFINEIPRLYHGIVRREIFTSVKKDHGRYFFGISLDISSSITICYYTSKFCLCHRSFSIGGSSNKSNSNIGFKRSAPDLFKSSHWMSYKDATWPEYIPPYLNAESVWAGTTVMTINCLDKKSLNKLCLNSMYSRLILKYPIKRKEICNMLVKSLSKLNKAGTPKVKISILPLCTVVEVAKYFIGKTRNLTKKTKTLKFEIEKMNSILLTKTE